MDQPKESLLQDFLQNIERIPADLTEAALNAATDEDEKTIIRAFQPTLSDQFTQLSMHLNEAAAKAAPHQRDEAEKYLRMSSGVSLATNLKSAFPSIGSIIGKLGIDGIIKEIKKIITKLLELLHITLPGWVLDLVNLIDEILANILGAGSTKTRTALSIAEQNYLGELTHLARLKKATRDLRMDEDEE